VPRWKCEDQFGNVMAQKKDKLDSEQRAMILVTIFGGFIGLLAGGYVGHMIGFHRGFKVGYNLNWESILECVEDGALHILDETGRRLDIEDLKKLTVL